MLTIDSSAFISFSNMGLFVGGEGWIHPEISTPTYELIFVVKGPLFIEEDGAKFCLQSGDLFVLQPGSLHRGYEKSDGTSFFWLHFFSDNYDRIGVKKLHFDSAYNCLSFFKKLNHLYKTGADNALIECMLVAFLLEHKDASTPKNKLFHDVKEFVRISIADAPKVREIANKFGYNADYLSRLFIANSGMNLKKFIDSERMNLIYSLLQNSMLTLKEIAEKTSFDDENALIKFFGNRAGCTPTQYRNRWYASHLNRS